MERDLCGRRWMILGDLGDFWTKNSRLLREKEKTFVCKKNPNPLLIDPKKSPKVTKEVGNKRESNLHT